MINATAPRGIPHGPNIKTPAPREDLSSTRLPIYLCSVIGTSWFCAQRKGGGGPEPEPEPLLNIARAED